MKDRTKQLVLKRDKGCILCILYNGEQNENLSGNDGGGFRSQRHSSPEPNGLHVHHEWGYYGNKRAGIPLQNWPHRNFKQQMAALCNSHHARRTQGNHYSEIRDIRLYLIELDPDYFSQFPVLGGTV